MVITFFCDRIWDLKEITYVIIDPCSGSRLGEFFKFIYLAFNINLVKLLQRYIFLFMFRV